MMLMVLTTSAQPCPDDNHPHAIDLGLPSGTKWACCNVGANTPLDYGVHYAWGETVEKDSFDLNTYAHCDGRISNCHDIGSDIAGTPYDVAHVKWGGNWVMPSQEQAKELFDNCNLSWATISDVNGVMITSKVNNNYIFLPAAGETGFKKFELFHVGKGGYYWSSTLHPSESGSAYTIHFYSEGLWCDFICARPAGLCVRPICVP